MEDRHDDHDRRNTVTDNEDIKAKMREALEKKNGARHPDDSDHSPREKVHGPEVASGAAPQMHRRKAGGGGA